MSNIINFSNSVLARNASRSAIMPTKVVMQIIYGRWIRGAYTNSLGSLQTQNTHTNHAVMIVNSFY